MHEKKLKQYLIRSVVDGNTMHNFEKLSYLQKYNFLIFSIVLVVMISFALVAASKCICTSQAYVKRIPS